ncbi:MAG: DnaJ domain-containing protein [Spirochaetes bacterium]|nr:DnaJ domain-containing protein [Spirochaetota bacterium]
MFFQTPLMTGAYYDKHGNIIDFYAIFNVPYGASEEEIKSAFRSLIKRYHPDLTHSRSEQNLEKIELIIRGYHLLIDEEARRDYDRALFQSRDPRSGAFPIIPKKRIKYSASLAELLRARINPRRMRRRDILYNIGQDVEIFITSLEAKRGAVAFVDLPTKMYCPLCMGSRGECYLCQGTGRISSSSQLEVRIPPHVDSSTYIDVDLLHIRPDRFTTFSIRYLRIKITITKEAK